MQIYLAEPMYKQVKAHRLPVSEILQKALKAELRRRELLTETDRYLAELIREIGPPSDAELARAEAAVRRMTQRRGRKAG